MGVRKLINCRYIASLPKRENLPKRRERKSRVMPDIFPDEIFAGGFRSVKIGRTTPNCTFVATPNCSHHVPLPQIHGMFVLHVRKKREDNIGGGYI